MDQSTTMKEHHGKRFRFWKTSPGRHTLTHCRVLFSGVGSLIWSLSQKMPHSESYPSKLVLVNLKDFTTINISWGKKAHKSTDVVVKKILQLNIKWKR